MAFDLGIQEIIGAICAGEKELIPRRMFGGVCYLFRGNMAF